MAPGSTPVPFSAPRSVFLPLLLCCATIATAQVPTKVAPPAPTSTYKMTVKLQPDARRLVGSQEIRWRNQTRRTVQELRFHLYLNAFRSTSTTFMREAGPRFRAKWSAAHNEFGHIKVTSISVTGADGRSRSVAQTQEFLRPNDGNPEDFTVMRVTLPFPVRAEEELTIKTEFEAQLPKAYRRTALAGGRIMTPRPATGAGLLASARKSAAEGAPERPSRCR